MPYITCDGKTYSRYDTSPYVKECIAKEEKYYHELRVKCDKDPDCVKDRKATDNLVFTIIFIGITLLGICLYKLFKSN